MEARGGTVPRDILRHILRISCLLLLLVFAAPPLTAAETQGSTQNINGAEIYKESRCFACHGQLGGGTIGPSLAGDKMLTVSRYVISQILIGRGIMPAFGDKLSDAQIAAVADYIRNSWGNKFGPVSVQEVTDTRNLMKSVSQETSPSPAHP